MNVILDGNKIPVPKDEIRSFGDLVGYLSERGDLQHRVIDSIVVNGAPLHDWEPVDAYPVTADVRVVTKSVQRLLLETLTECQNYLPRLVDGALLSAKRIHRGREREASALVENLVDGLQWYFEILLHTASVWSAAEDELSKHLSSLNGILETMVTAWETHDYALTADLLEYELAAELEAGLEFVDGLVANWKTSGIEH